MNASAASGLKSPNTWMPQMGSLQKNSSGGDFDSVMAESLGPLAPVPVQQSAAWQIADLMNLGNLDPASADLDLQSSSSAAETPNCAASMADMSKVPDLSASLTSPQYLASSSPERFGWTTPGQVQVVLPHSPDQTQEPAQSGPNPTSKEPGNPEPNTLSIAAPAHPVATTPTPAQEMPLPAHPEPVTQKAHVPTQRGATAHAAAHTTHVTGPDEAGKTSEFGPNIPALVAAAPASPMAACQVPAVPTPASEPSPENALSKAPDTLVNTISAPPPPSLLPEARAKVADGQTRKGAPADARTKTAPARTSPAEIALPSNNAAAPPQQLPPVVPHTGVSPVNSQQDGSPQPHQQPKKASSQAPEQQPVHEISAGRETPSAPSNTGNAPSESTVPVAEGPRNQAPMPTVLELKLREKQQNTPKAEEPERTTGAVRTPAAVNLEALNTAVKHEPSATPVEPQPSGEGAPSASHYVAPAVAPAHTQEPLPKQQTASLASAVHAEPALPEKLQAQPLRAFALEFTPDGAKDVRLHVSSHGGDVHVALRSTDETLSGKLRDGMQDLAGNLSNAGYDADAWSPQDERRRQQQEFEPEAAKPARRATGDLSGFEQMIQTPEKELL